MKSKLPIYVSAIICLITITSFNSPTVIAQQDGDPVAIGTYRVIDSQILGERRRLLVSLPRGYEGSAITYPVVYHTYGDYLTSYYATACATVANLGSDARIPQAILVGIDNIDRYRDLRPLQRSGEPDGINRYTEFLANEVIPFVTENYRVNDYRILVGPQAGAAFGLYTVLENPDLFDAFIVDNPFPNQDNQEFLLAKAADRLAAGEVPAKFFHITFGGEDDSPDVTESINQLKEFSATTGSTGLDLHLNRWSGAPGYLYPTALDDGLRTLFSNYHRGPDELFDSLAEVHEFYGQLSTEYGFEVAPAEAVMTFSADALLAAKDISGALEILEHQVTIYPNMVNGFWRLAEIATERDDKELAISYYKRCLEINPGLQNFVERRISDLND